MKISKKILSIILAVFVLMVSVNIFVFAKDSNVILRIEGIKANIYYGEVSVSENSSVLDVLEKASASKTFTFSASQTAYGVYLDSINGEKAGTFKGWDGWLYSVNAVSAELSIDEYKVKNGDSIVFYYGDPYGVGMQFPEVSISGSTISVTSSDTQYDAVTFEPFQKTNPVSNAKVTLRAGDSIAVLTTDENGNATICDEFLMYDEINVFVEKYADNGLPLVLRSAPDYSVKTKSNIGFFKRVILWLKVLFEKIIKLFSK